MTTIETRRLLRYVAAKHDANILTMFTDKFHRHLPLRLTNKRRVSAIISRYKIGTRWADIPKPIHEVDLHAIAADMRKLTGMDVRVTPHHIRCTATLEG